MYVDREEKLNFPILYLDLDIISTKWTNKQTNKHTN